MGSSVWPNYHFGHTGTVRQEVNEILEIETKRQGTGVRVTIKMVSIEIVIAIPQGMLRSGPPKDLTLRGRNS